MDRTPPVSAPGPPGLVMGAFAGSIVASLGLNFALRDGLDTWSMLGVWQYPGWVRAAPGGVQDRQSEARDPHAREPRRRYFSRL